MVLLFHAPLVLSWLVTASAGQSCSSTNTEDVGSCVHGKDLGTALLQQGRQYSNRVFTDGVVDNPSKVPSSLEHALTLVTAIAEKSGGHSWSMTPEEKLALETINDLVENLFNTSLIQHEEDQFEVNGARDAITQCAEDKRTRRANDIEPKLADANKSRTEHSQCRERENKIIANTSEECRSYHQYRKNQDNFDPPLDCMATALTWEHIKTDDHEAKHEMERCLVRTVETLEPLYEEYLGCKESNDLRKDASEECAREQGEFELDFCEYAQGFSSSCSTYSDCRRDQIAARGRVHDEVAKSEEARKADWVTATHLVCLLGVFETENDDKSAELAACMSKEVDTSSITISYPDIPAAEACIPEPHQPCDDSWLQNEYRSQLWYNSSTIETCTACRGPTPAPVPTPAPTPVTPPTIESECPTEEVSDDCQSEYDNAVADRDFSSFYNRCETEGGASPLRSRCSLCCTTGQVP